MSHQRVDSRGIAAKLQPTFQGSNHHLRTLALLLFNRKIFPASENISSSLLPINHSNRRKRPVDTNSHNQNPRLLNVGCGQRFHSSWTNVDLEPADRSVTKHDITQGLPCETGSYDGIYHSHVLEHLDPDDGIRLLDECHRVLKPGGVLRIVVPNLERIAKLYLEYHTKAWASEPGAAINYNWMKLELLDQLVRTHSGGRMGKYMSSDDIRNSGFVQTRVGAELSRCQKHAPANEAANESRKKKWKLFRSNSRTKLARWFVRRLMGKKGLRAFDEGMFRNCGEIHRWMYDRYSLREMCLQRGFIKFRVKSATDSGIEDYASYQLDAEGSSILKPDSLFVECRKPMVAGEFYKNAA